MRTLVILAVFLGGCLEVDLTDGALRCSPDPHRPCPKGYYCLEGRCWRNHHSPDLLPRLDMSAPTDMTVGN